MCRNDKVLMQYRLDLDLLNKVENAKFELNSVGRMGVTIKKNETSKWDALLSN